MNPPPDTDRPARRRIFTVRIGGESFIVEVEPDSGVPLVVSGPAPEVAGEASRSSAAPQGPAAAVEPTLAADEAAIIAPMPGQVLRYLVAEGDEVKRWQPVLVLEAMKMENSVPAPRDGRVRQITRAAGDMVSRGDVLAVIA